MFAYDICILAHDADGEAARLLGGSIRRYRLPRGVKAAGEDGGYSRILYLSAGGGFDGETEKRLADCRRLIVLCSPEARECDGLCRSLLYFEKLRSRSDIIPVIVRGEPLEAYPAFFIERRQVTHILPDGSLERRTETLEPVASDLRAETRRQAKQLLRYETVRIVASVLGLEPDALVQRQQRRTRRRAAIIAATVSAVCICVSLLFAYFSAEAQREGDIAAAMTRESRQVTDRLVTELPARFADDPAALALVNETIDEAMDIPGDGEQEGGHG